MKYRMLFAVVLMCALLAPAAAQNSALDRIRSTGAITMGYVSGSAPFSFLDANKEPQGYSVELCREIASGIRAQLGLATLEARWVELTLQNRLEAVASRSVDIECSTTTWTLTRQKDVDFSLITFVDGGSILTQAKADLGALAAFSSKRIAVITGTTTERRLKDALEQRGIRTEIVTVTTRDAGFRMLEEGKVDGFASDRIVLMGMVMATPARGAFKLLDEDFSVEPYALALPRGDHEFRLAVNRVLARVYRTGGIDPIYRKWLGAMGSPSLLLSAAYFIQGISE